jgi:hypothetical protein
MAKAVVPIDRFRGKFGDLSGVGIAARIGELAEQFLSDGPDRDKDKDKARDGKEKEKEKDKDRKDRVAG